MMNGCGDGARLAFFIIYAQTVRLLLLTAHCLLGKGPMGPTMRKLVELKAGEGNYQ